MRAEHNLLNCGDRLAWFFVDLFFVCGPEITSFECEHQKNLGFVLVVGVDFLSGNGA